MKLLEFHVTTTVIAPIRGWRAVRRHRSRTPARVSVRIAGSRTVAGCIRRRWRREACA
jgi:hypothetical protein